MFDQSPFPFKCPLSSRCFLRCGDSVPEVADNFGSSESLTVVLIFTLKPAAFEVGPRGLLHSISVTSNVSLICGDGRGVHVLLFFFLSLKPPSPSLHLSLTFCTTEY